MITLINGPYNGAQIEDMGTDPIRMSLYDRTQGPDVLIGFAYYIPGDQRARAFWDGNYWEGKLVEIIPA